MNKQLIGAIPAQGTPIALTEKIESLENFPYEADTVVGAPRGANYFRYVTRICLVFLLAICLWASADACDTTAYDLSNYTFRTEVQKLDSEHTYDWEIEIYLGESTDSLTDFHGLEVDLELSRGLDSGSFLVTDVDESWAGANVSANASLNGTRDEIHLILSVDNCGSASGHGLIGKIYVKGDAQASLRIPTAGGIVMEDNLDAFKWSSTTTEESLDEHLSQLEVYPNPVVDQLSIRSGDQPVADVYLWNLQGQQVGHWRPANTEWTSPSLNLAPGTYVLGLRHADGTIFRRQIQLQRK